MYEMYDHVNERAQRMAEVGLRQSMNSQEASYHLWGAPCAAELRDVLSFPPWP